MSASSPNPELFDRDEREGDWPRASASPERLDGLMQLVHEAEASQSDALLVWEKGHLLVERYFGQSPGAIELMSITKSIVSLALGMLIEEGKIPSVDTPLAEYYPDWKCAPYAGITLRHVLTHSSGLQHGESAAHLNAQEDQTRYALGRTAEHAPGSRISYNNEAVQLLSRLAEMASGHPLDIYVKRAMFDPLGIVDWSWKKDKTGVPLAYSGLSLRALDALRIGCWLLQAGRPLLGWVTPASGPAYLWWGNAKILYAHGWLGQYLVLQPDRYRVAVRLHRVRQQGGFAENAQCAFPTFVEKLDRLDS